MEAVERERGREGEGIQKFGRGEMRKQRMGTSSYQTETIFVLDIQYKFGRLSFWSVSPFSTPEVASFNSCLALPLLWRGCFI